MTCSGVTSALASPFAAINLGLDNKHPTEIFQDKEKHGPRKTHHPKTCKLPYLHTLPLALHSHLQGTEGCKHNPEYHVHTN
jgi:hypothetical protein